MATAESLSVIVSHQRPSARRRTTGTAGALVPVGE